MTKPIVCDSGPLIALFDASDRYHTRIVTFLKHNTSPLATTLAVVTEVCYMLDFDLRAQRDFLQFLGRGAVHLVELTTTDLLHIQDLMEKYQDRPMDFADGTVLCACEKLQTNAVLSVDNDFTIYRLFQKTRLVNRLKD